MTDDLLLPIQLFWRWLKCRAIEQAESWLSELYEHVFDETLPSTDQVKDALDPRVRTAGAELLDTFCFTGCSYSRSLASVQESSWHTPSRDAEARIVSAEAARSRRRRYREVLRNLRPSDRAIVVETRRLMARQNLSQAEARQAVRRRRGVKPATVRQAFHRLRILEQTA